MLEDPAGVLARLCAAVGVPFLEQMLSWEAGPRTTDGVWAKHWYGVVEASTGFEPYSPKRERVPPEKRQLHRQCLVFYRRLHQHRLVASPTETR